MREQGTLDKFIGDAVMAVWGNVRSQGDGGRRAASGSFRAGNAGALARLNAQWRAEGRGEFRFGVGLNHGEVITGDMGSPEKSEFTVIGDPINLASRMEGLTKNYGIEFSSARTWRVVSKSFHFAKHRSRPGKGKGRADGGFRWPRRADDTALAKYLDVFGDAIHLYRAGQFSEARAMFCETLDDWPEDPISQVYLKRCDEFIAQPPEANWDGVFTMHTK